MNYESPVQITDSQLKFDNDLISVSMEGGTMRLYDLLLGAIALFLMRNLVQLAIKEETGIKQIDDFTKNVSKLATWFIETVPIVPVPWSNIKIGAGSVFTDTILNEKIDSITGDFENKRVNQMHSLGQTFGFDIDNRIKESEKKKLSQILNQSGKAEDKLKTYKEEINKIKGKFYFSDLEWDLLSIFSGNEYRKELKTSSYGFSGVDEEVKDEKSFYKYLDKNNGWKKLYKVFFGSDNAPSSKDDLDNNKEKYAIQRAS